MTLVPTPHIEAKLGDFAKTVLMPGHPKRAEYIAKTYLTDYKLVNDVRGIKGYTGFYKGKRVSVMASGMGQPSIGIYSYELFAFYGVENIIRVGSCGSFDKDEIYIVSYFDALGVGHVSLDVGSDFLAQLLRHVEIINADEIVDDLLGSCENAFVIKVAYVNVHGGV